MLGIYDKGFPRRKFNSEFEALIINRPGVAPVILRRLQGRLILADDSVATRSLEKSILESAGYEVIPAADGVQSWQLLQERGADLLVSDVEMPNMDGFQLTEAVRSSQRFSDLPVSPGKRQ